VDQAILVMPDLAAASEALAELDGAGVEKITAVLMLDPEYENWRFLLSSPSLDQAHPLKAHEKVHQILGGQFVYRLPPFLVLPTKDPFIRELKKSLNGLNATGHIPVSLAGLTVADRQISAGYLLRLPGVLQ
jgi:hypothetical protein